MLKRLKITSFILFCLAGAQLARTGASAQDAPAEKFFKNIQALKGVPAGQIAGLMDSYNKALGVSCEYCHVAGDLSKGDKPAHQLSVRDIRMTREINDKYKHAVDCMSCHQGKAKPAIGTIAIKPGPTTDPKKEDKADSKKHPVKFTFTATPGVVPFPHDTHMSMDCTKCHHQGGNSACGACHKHNNGDTGLSFKKVSHSATSTRGCTGCHKQMSVGPQACNTCHVQEDKPDGAKAAGPGPSKLTFTASFGKVGFPHDTHMSMDCTKCHHKGDTSACSACHKHNAGDVGLSFKKVSHSTTSNRACAGCHKEMNVGPKTCASCHKA
jgi:hypothetical protein